VSNNASKPTTVHLKDYKIPTFTIEQVDLTVELGEEITVVTSLLHFSRQAQSGSHVHLHGENLVLKSLRVEGQERSIDEYTLSDKELSFIAPSDNFSASIVTEIKPQENTALEGLYKSSGNFCTQCEAEGFRKITYFMDRPDVMAKFSTTIIGDGDKYPVMLSNGNMTLSDTLDDGRQRRRWVDPHPKPAYLFALVAGDLACVEDQFKTASGRDVTLQIFVEHGNEDKCAHAMTSLKKSMTWDEEKFGREYDLDIFMIVAVSDFNMGAMENKGLNVFNSKYVLASTDTATDVDFDGIESVIAHEYFHNWTGNRITCRDWFQLTLKEGLTVFRDQQFSADMNSAAVKRIDDVQRLRAAQFPEDSGPLAHPIQPQSYVEINNFYTATVYEKGAEVIRMIHTLIGEESFRKGMDVYFDRHDGQAVTTEDFVIAMEDGSGQYLSQFKNWYLQAGTPHISVTEDYDADAKTYTLNLTQKNHKEGDDAAPLHIPVKLGLLDSNGANMLDGTDGDGTVLVELTNNTQNFLFSEMAEKPTPSLFRGFSAPVKVIKNPADENLGHLFRHDSDPFNRWEAGQRLASQCLLQLVSTHGNEDAPNALPDSFMDAFEAILKDETLDPAYKAEALSLPGEAYIGQQMAVVDVDAIHDTRQQILWDLGTYFKKPLQALYDHHSSKDSVGDRALKNLSLHYLVASDQDTFIPVAKDQYFTAQNMTDRVSALARLVASNDPARALALQDFYDRWQKDQLVLDKWFTLQATSSREQAMDDVLALMDHPDFTLLNPNRVRSLVAAFAGANPIHFHNKSGRGYQFLSARIQELNKTNPQIAARLVGPLGQWRRYDTDRQTLMKQELQNILDLNGISNDVYEMVNKSLNN
jgi:aminopeptidase N